MSNISLTSVQKLAIGYAVMFFGIFALNYVPMIHDDRGYMLGLFHLDLIDDALHLGSSVWSLGAGLKSHRQAVLYFRVFGALYGMDGVIGLLTGSGYLDLGIFRYGVLELDLTTRFFANLPHLLIGGGAVFIGYFLAKQVKS